VSCLKLSCEVFVLLYVDLGVVHVNWTVTFS
jgi:hypothetical protein